MPDSNTKVRAPSLYLLLAIALYTVALTLNCYAGSAAQGDRTPPPPLRADLTVQESIYEGVPGVSRQQDPVSAGLPIADSAEITNISQLGLSGAKVGQFRVLGRWPSGNIQWVLVDTLADVVAGKINNSVSLTNGSGNFGGPDLATENASIITVSTGVSTFVMRKKNFNLLDQTQVNDKVLIKPGSSVGLVLAGPSPGNTTCPCSTIYASSNDSRSSAVIEENGPVRAVVRATGQLKDEAGNSYMRFTVRMHFYRGKTRVKAVVLLQNADYGASGSFVTAYKGFRSFEVRLTPALGAGLHISFGGSSSRLSADLLDNESADIYQGYSDKMLDPQWSSPDTRSNYAPRSYIARTVADQQGSHRTWKYTQYGCKATNNNKVLTERADSQYCAGWADVSDSNGAGVTAGNYQMAAYWPKSIQFENHSRELRLGIWPDQSVFGAGAQDYYQPWPQYSIHTIYLSFHSSTGADPESEFHKLQHPLLARAAVSYYNHSQALLYPIVEAEREDQYFKSLGLACCAQDISPHVHRTYGWRAAGSGNQAEMRWANLMLWLQRGQVGRYIDASHFYLFQAEQVFPRSDFNGDAAFDWRDAPDSDLDPTGLPANIVSLNNNVGCDPGEKQCGRNWIDNAHAHWYGMIDYYFLSGDETIKEAILDGASDLYGNPKVKVVKNGAYWNTRNVGEALMSDARLAMFYRAVGDSRSAENALLAGSEVLTRQVWRELEVSGFGNSSQGVSRTRGMHFGCCPKGENAQRFAMPFQEGILGEGLWEFLQAEGPDWPQRQLTLDLAYGVASWSLNEMWRSEGTGNGCQGGSGLAYELFIDRTNDPLNPSCVHTVWFNFYNYAQYTGDQKLWRDKFEQYLKHINGNGNFYGEIGTVFEGAVVGLALKQEQLKLLPILVKVESTKTGAYRLTWTVPSGAQSYRLKYSDKNIVEWLNFDPVSNHFTIDPVTHVPWFAAADISKIPAPGPAGTTQAFDIDNLASDRPLHFDLRAYVKPDLSTGN